MAPRAGAGAGAGEDDVKDAYQLIEEALEWIGAGAKTSVGFGRLKESDKPWKVGDMAMILAHEIKVKILEINGDHLFLENPNIKKPYRNFMLKDIVRV